MTVNMSVMELNDSQHVSIEMELNDSQNVSNGVEWQFLFLFVWFDSLRPLNNLSVMRDGLPGLNQY